MDKLRVYIEYTKEDLLRTLEAYSPTDEAIERIKALKEIDLTPEARRSLYAPYRTLLRLAITKTLKEAK